MAEEQAGQANQTGGGGEAKAPPIRTLQSDVADVMKGGQGSLAKIAIAESQKRAGGGAYDFAADTAPDRTGLVVGISIALVLIGALAVGITYVIKKNDSNKPAVAPPPPPLITSENEKRIAVDGLTRKEIIAALVKERDAGTATLSTVTTATLTETRNGESHTLSAPEFLERLAARAPSELTRSLGTRFVLGFHTLNVRQPFLLLKTEYYQNAFAGMLGWEKTLEDDLGPLFIRKEIGAAATTSADILSRVRGFEDAVIKNRDARVLRDTTGKVVFLYSFPDKASIIITTNPDTLAEISARLVAGKLTQSLTKYGKNGRVETDC